ncbi:hypothetical protein BJH93_07300 [Kocuria polaris]|nr:hypothetical protein [Kocuria polaris]
MPTPRRRPSPAVYRRRRLVVLLAMLVVVGLIVWGSIAAVGALRAATTADPDVTATSPEGGGGDDGSPSAGDGPGASKSPESTKEPTSCSPRDVVVKASTEQRRYGPEENPVLVMTVENSGGFDCEVNVGTGEQEFLVTSGKDTATSTADRIFSTADCLADPADLHITLKPGQQETARFTWERVRSAPGCQAVSAKPRPGTYLFQAKLGNRDSNVAVFELQ